MGTPCCPLAHSHSQTRARNRKGTGREGDHERASHWPGESTAALVGWLRWPKWASQRAKMARVWILEPILPQIIRLGGWFWTN